MNPIDLFIIYLTCGAPFGVYYFFQNRTPAKSNLLWFKTFLNFFFWLPFAFRLLRRNVDLRTLPSFGWRKTLPESLEQEAVLHLTVKRIEKIFLAGDSENSVYEFRETIERYIGLTIASQIGAARTSDAETDFFRVARPNNNVELGAICLIRRNRKRLVRHQTEARRDFLYLINQLLEFDSDEKKLEQSAIEFVIILKDCDAQNKLEKMFASSLQTADRFSVTETEKDLWKPLPPKLSTAKQISYHLPTMKATLNSPKKD